MILKEYKLQLSQNQYYKVLKGSDPKFKICFYKNCNKVRNSITDLALKMRESLSLSPSSVFFVVRRFRPWPCNPSRDPGRLLNSRVRVDLEQFNVMLRTSRGCHLFGETRRLFGLAANQILLRKQEIGLFLKTRPTMCAYMWAVRVRSNIASSVAAVFGTSLDRDRVAALHERVQDVAVADLRLVVELVIRA